MYARLAGDLDANIFQFQKVGQLYMFVFWERIIINCEHSEQVKIQ